MSRAVRSTWSMSASDASSKSRCASSKKKHSFGFGRSPDLGQALVQLGEHPEHERREQPGLVHDVRQLEDADDPLALGRRPQQVLDLELGLAEEDVGALLLEHDDRAQQHARPTRVDIPP